KNNLNITRILDITQELRFLSDQLEVENAPFVFDGSQKRISESRKVASRNDQQTWKRLCNRNLLILAGQGGSRVYSGERRWKAHYG
ncbi:hypothetical protein B9Z19DRAFT_1154042, partial [Tuber borchii]